ncbi:bleomycin resistance protein [Flavobacterium ponti]|uniref:Bleomycin resistance protein n=1 Tax=Flavobacterium ponti TaxID=665133 RepID=A0ABV9NZT2_9FLAO
MINFKTLRPILWTIDIKETIGFYENVLGFTCDEYNEEWQWASLSKNGVEIMLAKPNEHTSFNKSKFTGSFYINVDNVDALWQCLKDTCKVCYEIENFPWQMREFAIYDNNGYILQFGKSLKN